MITVLGGAIVRHGKNDWRWRDGTPEPRVQDLTSSQVFNFRCRNVGGETHVEVLLSTAHRERELLQWVLNGVESGKYSQAFSGDHTGPLVIGDSGLSRMRIEPGEDPLADSEPAIDRRSIPLVALVPVSEWDAWSDSVPYGAQWDSDEGPSILEHASQFPSNPTTED